MGLDITWCVPAGCRRATEATFSDNCGDASVMRESTLDGTPTLWLGLESGAMCITQEQAAELLPYIARFAEMGTMGGPK